MKKNIICYLLIFINILLSEVKIGYVDSQQIMTQYEGFRTAQIELEKEQKRLEAEYFKGTGGNKLTKEVGVYFNTYMQDVAETAGVIKWE